MVEVIVTIVEPQQYEEVDGQVVKIWHDKTTQVYRLEFDRPEDAMAYLVSGRHGIDVRDSVENKATGPKCLSFEQLVGKTTEDLRAE